ncbi:MAG: decarboxylating NADP(+)-dependent phosphogluconate dehydrogenase [Victivallales bacterium]|nr:decarboxylating NADP(+)-dependent phosphogluconate dehydrogenase [Victivallales bacterium]
MSKKADIGLIGLGVMGENLVLNMAGKGFTVAVFNRTAARVDDFVNDRGKSKHIIGCRSIPEFINALETPRKVMLMVKAGAAVDALIDSAVPHLAAGDIIIDGGNSYFQDTVRRTRKLEEMGLRYIGAGISGGEEGALLGPSIMPGGSPEAWPAVKPLFQSIAARADDGSPCCEWVGNDGAGHYVKMIHNGIEYGDMQLICEAYYLLKSCLGMTAGELQRVFADWNTGKLDSYLMAITGDILAAKDAETGLPLVDLILDTAGQKGTGKWSSQSALELGVPTQTIAEAVFARCLSALKEERVAAAKVLSGPAGNGFSGDRTVFTEDVRNALYASKICSYAQGFQLLRTAAAEYGWDLKYGEIALMWRGGCIIRARFLDAIKAAFAKTPELPNLLFDDFFKNNIVQCQQSWRRVVAAAVMHGIPVPAFSSALSYYDSYRSAVLPANLLQAQRDFFGAHTYERNDRPRGEFFHTHWNENNEFPPAHKV